MARIGYVDDPRSLAVNEIAAWDRENAPEMISGGSGPKDYTCNKVRMLFDAAPDVDRITLVRGNGPMFFLMRRAHCWFDISGKQVVAR